MFIDVNSIKVNDNSWGQYLLQAEYQHPKLWGEDTGRNLAGDFSGTLIGIYPKIIMTFRKLTKSEMDIVAPVLDSASQTVTYYDPATNTTKTMDTYTGDWGYISRSMRNKIDDSFECSFISIGKRV
jgi:hypothetical protein